MLTERLVELSWVEPLRSGESQNLKEPFTIIWPLFPELETGKRLFTPLLLVQTVTEENGNEQSRLKPVADGLRGEENKGNL